MKERLICSQKSLIATLIAFVVHMVFYVAIEWFGCCASVAVVSKDVLVKDVYACPVQQGGW